MTDRKFQQFHSILAKNQPSKICEYIAPPLPRQSMARSIRGVVPTKVNQFGQEDRRFRG